MTSDASSISKRLERLSSSKQLLLTLIEARTKLEAVEHSKTEPIAIIGMGCRFPGGATNPEIFWNVLRDGVDAITEIPKERWDMDAYYDPNPEAQGKIYTRYGGFLQQIEQFDPEFFGISPREAISLDPQQRLLLQVSWEALENAAIAADRLSGSRTGIFVGIGQNDYAQLRLTCGEPKYISTYDGTGNGFCFASGRLSYTLGLQGPNLAIDTACSSSLVAVHLACQSLRAGECDMALAGGVHLILSPEVTIFLSRARALSPDGRCKTFDASANGYGRGEGCGVLVLKRFTDAVANRDNVLAVIRGSAVNHDGLSSGLTVPNGLAQQALIRQALKNSKEEASSISYVETHGTGTSLGDPIEVKAIADVLGEGRSPEEPLVIGSVKTNIGHLEAAAGVAGLMKVVLALQHKEIPPHLHFKQPNPHINWDEIPVMVPSTRMPWTANGRPRLAGVSSFGISGTNAHIVLAEAPLVPEPLEKLTERPLHLLALSAKSEETLKVLANRYNKYLTEHPFVSLGDICFSANTGRSHFNHRLSVVASSTAELSEKLASYATGVEAGKVQTGQVQNQPKVVFLFPGEGSQYLGMGQQLYQTQSTFRSALARCDQVLQSYSKQSLLEVLYPQFEDTSLLNETPYTQVALFAVEYALAELWQSWGIEPAVVIGYGIGEYVGACVAGELSLEDAMRLVLEQGGGGSLTNSIETLLQQGYELFLECGPRAILSEAKPSVELRSLCPEDSDWQVMLESLGVLYTHGVPVDWSSFDRDYPYRRIPLPTYPFNEQQYWVQKTEKHDQKTEPAQIPIENILRQGDTQKLTQLLIKAGNFSEDKMKLLPELLEVLVKEYQQQLTAASVQDCFYQLEWEPKPRQVKTASRTKQRQESGIWLILADSTGVGQALAELLHLQGQAYVLVLAGEVADFERLFDEIWTTYQLPIIKIVHLWSLAAPPSKELTLSALEQAIVLGCGSVLHLVQAVVQHKKSVLPQLWLVTRGGVPVSSGELAVAQAPLWGLGKSLGLEHPELWGGMFDLDPDSGQGEAGAIFAEIEDSQGEDHLALRCGQRYVARLIQSQRPEGQKITLRSNATYLITGGLGFLGLKMAQWLVEQGVRYLVLTGRSAVSTQAQETINYIKQIGATILVAQADVSNETDMARLLEEIEVSMPPLGGIVHGAGVFGYQATRDMDLNELQSVLRPKVLGAWILHQLTQHRKLDFFLCFSSIASVWGSKGQAHYAAANHFLDVLAYYRQSLGYPALSINWGPWAGGGMASSFEAQQWLTQMGIKILQPNQAFTALESLLEGSCPQSTIAHVDWSVFKDLYEVRGQGLLLEKIKTLTGEVVQEQKQHSDIVQRLQVAVESERQAILIAYLQTEVAKVLGRLELSQLPEPHQGFFEMGMDSLMAIELKKRLEVGLGDSLPATLILECSTIKDLAGYLVEEVLPIEFSAASTLESEPVDEEADLSATLQKLSQDEIADLLAQKLACLD